jgi:xanthine dehydrogenase accessory factor
MASAIGYDVVIIDPRSAFTSPTRFDPETAITGWPEAKLTAFADDPFTAIVTLTHVGHIDDDALKIALRSNCRYVGALGSRKTHAARVARLKSAGFTDAETARIHAPVGLALGGRAPGEIAVSILAEIVAAFNGKLLS